MGMINCVPLVGQVFMIGYLYDWAKEASWGMKTSLPLDVGDIGRRGKYGLMVFGVTLVWIVPVVIISLLLRLVPVVGDVLSFLMDLFSVFVWVIASAAALRSIIYERMMPGFQFGRVLKMARRDTSGLWQSLAIALLNVVLVVAALFVLLLPTVPFVVSIMSSSPTAILGADFPVIVMLGMLTIVVSLVVWVAGAVVSALIFALYARAIGYWMEQFEPAKWRSPAEPMPFEVEMEAEKKAKAEAKAAAKAKKKAAKKKVPEKPAEENASAEQQAGEQPVEPMSAADEAADKDAGASAAREDETEGEK